MNDAGQGLENVVVKGLVLVRQGIHNGLRQMPLAGQACTHLGVAKTELASLQTGTPQVQRPHGRVQGL